MEWLIGGIIVVVFFAFIDEIHRDARKTRQMINDEAKKRNYEIEKLKAKIELLEKANKK